MKYKNIVFTIHESIKNLGNFRSYLIDNTEYLVTFHFPHGYLPKSSYVEVFKNGSIVLRKEFPRYKGKNNIIKLILYYAYFQYVLLRYARKDSFVIVENPIFCIFNSIPSFIKKTKFVLWVGDFFPQNTGFMWFYNKMADFYNKTLDYVIYVSPPTFNIYKKRTPKRDGQFRKIISLGMKREILHDNPRSQKPVLGFIGVIREQQGLDLALEFVTKHNVFLEIIGDGYKKEHYQKMANKLKINSKVKFYGFIDDPSNIFKKWIAGLALYENTVTNVSKYCEPVKIKDYLEHNLPVITTSTTYMAQEIKKYKAGEVVEENTKSLWEAVEKITKNYNAYKLGIDKMHKKYEYIKWYDSAFRFLRKASVI